MHKGYIGIVPNHTVDSMREYINLGFRARPTFLQRF